MNAVSAGLCNLPVLVEPTITSHVHPLHARHIHKVSWGLLVISHEDTDVSRSFVTKWVAKLFLKTQSIKVAVPLMNATPPLVPAQLFSKTQSINVAVPVMYATTPFSASLFSKTQSIKVAVPTMYATPP